MKQRESKPYNNKYYITIDKGGYSKNIKGKPTDKNANVLANCVGYANGRFAEIIGEKRIQYQFIQNADTFVNYAKKWGLQVVDVPSLGGIMCFQHKKKKNGGHVFIVEKLISKDKIYISSSSWNGSAFYNATKTKSTNWGMGSDYKFLGCIVNPKIGFVPYDNFVPNTNYKTTTQLYVRCGAGTNYDIKRVKDLTEDGKKNAVYKNPNQLAIYKEGTIYTALEVIKNEDGIWARTPSGYVCMQTPSGKDYCVKC